LGLHLMWRAYEGATAPVQATSAAWHRKCTAEALRQPQCERPNCYGGSGHGQSSVTPTYGRGARDLGPHLMWRALLWCFLPISAPTATGQRKCIVQALSQPQHEWPNRYGGSGHGQSSVSGIRGGRARDLRRHLMWRAVWERCPSISATFALSVGEHSCQSQRRLTAKALSFGGGCLGTLLRVCVCASTCRSGWRGDLRSVPSALLVRVFSSVLYRSGLSSLSLSLCGPPLCVAFLPGLPAMWAGGC
jgi:hypothetical protein